MVRLGEAIHTRIVRELNWSIPDGSCQVLIQRTAERVLPDHADSEW
jgi:hypothetical protein